MRKVKASVGVVTVTALAVAAMLLAPHLAMSSLPTESPAKVTVARVTAGQVERMIALSGRLRYQEEYAALAPHAGIVAQVYVQPGDTVTAGQALFRMDDTAEVAALSAAYQAASGLDADALAAFADAADAVQARLRLEALTVRAQADGLVQQVSVAQRGGVAAGAAAMLLTGTQQRVVCQAVMRDAAELEPGMRARILSGGVTACAGTVTSVSAAQTDALTGQVVCEVAITPDGYIDLPMGAPVEAEIILAAAEDIPVLPVTAVTESGSVWWIADGRAWETPVAVPLRDETRCWVSLPEGAAVVDTPDGLIHGQRVKEVRP